MKKTLIFHLNLNHVWTLRRTVAAVVLNLVCRGLWDTKGASVLCLLNDHVCVLFHSSYVKTFKNTTVYCNYTFYDAGNPRGALENSIRKVHRALENNQK